MSLSILLTIEAPQLSKRQQPASDVRDSSFLPQAVRKKRREDSLRARNESELSVSEETGMFNKHLWFVLRSAVESSGKAANAVQGDQLLRDGMFAKCYG